MKAKTIGIFICVCGVVLASSSFASKKITRSCKAYYEITTRQQGMDVKITLGNFSTTGSCGKSVKNRCRERARDNAHQCMETHWRIPEKADVFWKPCTSNYSITEPCLSCVIRNEFCKVFRAGEMVVDVTAVTTGDTGCPKRRTLASGYRIRCGQ